MDAPFPAGRPVNPRPRGAAGRPRGPAGRSAPGEDGAMTSAPRPGVLLDVDGTLLDTNYLQVLAWWRAFRDTGHPEVSMADCHRSIGIGSAELVAHLLGDDVPDAKEISAAKDERYQPLRELVDAFP